MTNQKFSPGARLLLCAEYVRSGDVVADIGTDHAYLPIYLAGNNISSHVYASDINEEPIALAERNIKKCGLEGRITTYIGDGLAEIPKDEVDDIIIAGMGSENIIGIIDGAQWLKEERYRLILQPMSRSEKLRRYLYDNGFKIISEKSVCEAKRVYTVICAEYSGHRYEYNDIDIYLGKLSRDDQHISKIAQKQIGILESEAHGLEKNGFSEGADNVRRTADVLRKYIEK